jgi:hypothetical protein
MEVKQTLSQTNSGRSMLENEEYFKYIFKKTEKIACAVFYILRSESEHHVADNVVHDLENASRSLLNASLVSLKSSEATIESTALQLRHELIAFESKLRMAHAARLLSAEFLQVFLHEIDSVQRSLRKFIEPASSNPLISEGDLSMVTRERKVRPKAMPMGIVGIGSAAAPQVSRRERVMNVLKDKGEATIKDITEVISDCSEKTIQRELISLIRDNIVHREGERRWSKYKLV